MCHRFKV
jgi:hypothetical protein